MRDLLGTSGCDYAEQISDSACWISRRCRREKLNGRASLQPGCQSVVEGPSYQLPVSGGWFQPNRIGDRKPGTGSRTGNRELESGNSNEWRARLVRSARIAR